MAAYAALVSLMNIIDTLHKHPSPPLSMHKKQVRSLTQNVTFLQEFLDGYISPFSDSHEADPLERRIADAVYAAEDVIESHIVAQIQRRSTVVKDHRLNQDLQKVIEGMKLITKEVKKKIADEPHLKQKCVAAPTYSSTVKEIMMVGFEEVFLEVLDKLTGYQLNRQIIPITGMGGIGKTTLAKYLFDDALVKEHFDIRAWTTISQTYDVRETLRQVFFQASGESSHLSENELGQKLYKFLYGRRYLVIMDDMWSIEVWEKIKFFFPDNNNGSRIVVTTRLSNLSSQLNDSYIVCVKFLDEASSWDLFCKIVFGKESCPDELENTGKNIVANCKGLPLSIATIGGLLEKSKLTREYWEDIDQKLNSIVIDSNEEFCLKTLKMSYIYLPNYLKPCFLYMGVFKEDCRIRVSVLMKLWISEGFLKPRSGKCFEEIANEYFKELVDRNLILVDELGSIGNMKYCKIHDLLRELCLKEVEKDRFYHVIKGYPPANSSKRRVVFPRKTARLLTSGVLRSLSHARSIIRDNCDKEVRLPHNLRLLRTLKAYDETSVARVGYFLENVFESVNLRYLAVTVHEKSEFPCSIDLLWNLHTLIIQCSYDLIAPIEIWKLHQLRHLVVAYRGLILPDPPSGDNDIVIMDNLRTLKGVKNLNLNEEMVKRFPNVKKLYLLYDEVRQTGGENCLRYLECLSKLESFHCSTSYLGMECWKRIKFPYSLKKLKVDVSRLFALEDIMPKIGSLPLLEKFVLIGGRFETRKWETTDGQFPSLKFLRVQSCRGLEEWIVQDKCHFPLLQKLHLCYLDRMDEIPSEVGEIPTLKSISLEYCSNSVVVSAKKILEELEDSYGDQPDLHVRAIVADREEETLKSLASANFEVKVLVRVTTTWGGSLPFSIP